MAERLSDTALAKLRAVGLVVELPDCTPDRLREAVVNAQALVVRTYAQVDAAVIGAGKNLTVIGRAGIGVENIDLAAARAAGIVVVHTPAASTQAVAELTLGLLINLERHIMPSVQQLRTGRFHEVRNQLACRELGEMTLGIIGFGRIGQRVARIVRTGFGMEILFNDIREIRSLEAAATPCEKEELYARADAISLHVPLTDQTRRLIRMDILKKMKPTSLLINTSRGAVVDSEDLAEALKQGVIAGAAVDVFDPEPPPADHPLLSAPNCLCTPHIASRSARALAAMNDVVDDVIAVLENRPPRFNC